MFISHSLKRTLTFRRWSRRSFAVFNSLKTEIRIGVLALACTILTVPGKALGRDVGRDALKTLTTEDEGEGLGVLALAGVSVLAGASALGGSDTISDKFDLQGVVVSAQRSPVLHSELMRSVQVITASEIARSPTNDIAGLLQQVRGVDIRRRGGFGIQADVGIRGGTFDQTMVLLNGINITDPQTGHHNLNIPVDLQSIDRIEVLRGSGARLFGPNAFSGAINIITKEPGKAGFNASLSGGQYGYGNIAMSGGWNLGNTGHHLAASGMTSVGYRHNTDFTDANLYYRGMADLGLIRLDAQAGYNRKAFGANGFYSPRFPDQFEETETGFFSLNMLPTNIENLTITAYWRRHSDRFELFRNEAPEWYQNHNHHLTQVVGAFANYSFLSRAGKTSLGLDYRYEHIYSNVLGEPMPSGRAVAGFEGVDYTHSFVRSGLSLFAEHSVYVGELSFSGGMLAYLNTELDNTIGLFPGIDMAWQFDPQWRWFSTYNRTLRLPTFTDLFYSGPTNLGNPNLQPEQATSLETGIKGMPGTISLELTAFRRWGRQMIDWVKYPSDELWLSMNHTAVNTTGVEAYLDIPMHTLPMKPMVRLQYMYIHTDKQSDEYVSNYVLDHLRHKVDLSLRVDITRRFGASLMVSWRDRAGSYLLYADDAFQQMQPFEPHWLADARVHYDVKRFRFFIDGTNLFNTRYADIANLPQVGRWVVAGVGYKSLR